jgi:hypothetical protein
MPAFEQHFRMAAGHRLCEVRCTPRTGPLRDSVEWEHEEYDADGRLVAVYESWTRGDDITVTSFVKYSPTGWVLLRSGVPRLIWPPEGGWPPPYCGAATTTHPE